VPGSSLKFAGRNALTSSEVHAIYYDEGKESKFS
jgi:hypothetical protein